MGIGTIVASAAAGGSGGGTVLGEISDWIHLDAIQALVHHATAVITAIFLFGVTARLIAYLIPNGHAKKIVIIIDDVILLAVFALAGYRLLSYMWSRPHLEAPLEEALQTSRPDPRHAVDGIDALIAECRSRSAADAQVHLCLKETNAQAQRAMEQMVARMALDMKALDQVGSVKVGAARSFDTAQQAFQLYRETECRWRSTAATNGAANDIYQACMASLARRRAAQVARLLRK